MSEVLVCESDFDIGEEYQNLCLDLPGIGGVVTFVGRVRDLNKGNEIATLELQHYPGMTEQLIQDIVEQAKQRWNIERVRVIHRVGKLQPSDQIVFVGVASAHRGDAFAAAEFIMDYLKTKATFWKKEYRQNQTENSAQENADSLSSEWLEMRDTDLAAAKRWEK